MSNPQIDEWCELGLANGAIGGKLVGAGGGGFLLFYSEDHKRLRQAMARAGLEEVRFRFDFEGTKFAGRIADTGRDPVPMMASAVEMLKPFPNVELIWASPRELLNIFQADAIGCHIITATNDILKKLPLLGKNLEEYSLETVKMFYNDAQQAGYKL